MPNFAFSKIDPCWAKSIFIIQNITSNICWIYIYENLNWNLGRNFEILTKWAKFWKKHGSQMLASKFQKIDKNSWLWQFRISRAYCKSKFWLPKLCEILVIVFDAIAKFSNLEYSLSYRTSNPFYTNETNISLETITDMSENYYVMNFLMLSLHFSNDFRMGFSHMTQCIRFLHMIPLANIAIYLLLINGEKIPILNWPRNDQTFPAILTGFLSNKLQDPPFASLLIHLLSYANTFGNLQLFLNASCNFRI